MTEAVSLVNTLRAKAQRARASATRLRRSVGARILVHLPAESQHLFALTITVGIVCGFVAVAFHLGIKVAESLLIDRAMTASGNTWMAWTVVTPMIGGLIAGALLTYVVPGARGSGIPQVKTAFALNDGRVRFRDAFGKFWIGILQIGSGASLGREGPTVQICAGATSLLARLTGLPAKNTRRLLPVGVAAGIAAAFNAPIAAVTFTIEEIVGSLDHAVLSGVVVAAALAAVIERGVLGVHPVIEVQQTYGLSHASSLLTYAILGIAGGLVSIVFTDGLLTLRKSFRDLKAIPRWSQPAVGGLVTGVLAVLALKTLQTTGVTGGGYETLGKALAGHLELKVLLALCAIKLVATVFSYSSGGAGGIFAPSLFVGAMLGGAFGYLDVAIFHHPEQELGAFALVGMGAVFAGVIRAPITSVLIIFEMTGGYGLVLPLMLANMTSYVLARRFRPTPIYEELLKQDGIVLPHAVAQVHILDQLAVADAMTSEVVSVKTTVSVDAARASLGPRGFESVPAFDDAGSLAGVVRITDLMDAVAGSSVASLVRPAQTILANAPLSSAVVRMSDKTVRCLVVLDAETARNVVGVVAIRDLIKAHARAMGTVEKNNVEVAGSAGLHQLVARDLAQAATSVGEGASVQQIIFSMAASPSGVVIVRTSEQKITGMVAFESAREFLGDEHLQKILVAVDLVRAVPIVAPDASLREMITACMSADSPGLLVLGAGLQGTEAVVSRAVLGAVLLRSYVKLPPARIA